MMSAAAGGTSADGSGNTSGRGISGSSTGNGANNNDPEIDHVIERCLDEEIQKANLDTYKYRYIRITFLNILFWLKYRLLILRKSLSFNTK